MPAWEWLPRRGSGDRACRHRGQHRSYSRSFSRFSDHRCRSGSRQVPQPPRERAGMAALNSTFSKLGIPPEAASQFVPVLTDYVGKVGGPEAANLLKGLF